MSNISAENIRLGGVSEVAQELRLSRQRIAQLRESPAFPSPIAEISAGPIWDLDVVSRWNTSGRRRSPGRPSSQDHQRIFGGSYLLDDTPIGSGGFADVYSAVDTRRKQNHPHAIVAIKVLRGLDDVKVRRRFQREIRLVAECNHPGVVRILNAGKDEHGRLWYAMPLAEGSLADEIDRFDGNDDAVLDVMRQICAAVAYVHDLGIYHRDITPRNILRVNRSAWALSDFGLAREAERKSTALTNTLQGVGTPCYAAPETMRGAKFAEAPADIFGLGKVLQHLVTGELPVEDDLDLGRFRMAVTTATRPKPTDRYESAAALLASVEMAARAPSTWQAEQEITDDLANRLRFKSPDDSAIAELISIAEASSTSEAMENLHLVIPRMSSGSIRLAWRSYRHSFSRLLKAYSAVVATTGYEWNLCDTIADFWDQVVRTTADADILYLAVKALSELGESHNRWHVRDVLIGILQRVRNANDALAAAEALKEVSPSTVAWVFARSIDPSLHPTIREEAERILLVSSKKR